MRTFDLTAALGDRANQPEISRLLVAPRSASRPRNSTSWRTAWRAWPR